MNACRTSSFDDARFVIPHERVQESYVVATRKLTRHLSEEDAEHALRLLTALPVVQVDTAKILAAV